MSDLVECKDQDYSWSVNDYYAAQKAGGDAEKAFLLAGQEKFVKSFGIPEAEAKYAAIINGHLEGDANDAYWSWRHKADAAQAAYLRWEREPQVVRKKNDIFNKAVDAYYGK